MRDYRIMAMMKRAKKCVLAGALAAALSAAAFAVYAEDAPAPDAPDFSQMCRQLETLLEEENTAVSFNAAAVQAAPGYHPAAPAGESSDAAEGEEQPQGPDRDRFMADIKNAYNARLSVLHRYESFPTMKQDTYDTFRFLCVEAERPFYEAYADAKFENKNYQSLCDRYIKGLKDQLDAEALWREGGDKKEIEALYYEGYDVRAGVLLELQAFYFSGEEDGLEDADELESSLRLDQIVPKGVEKNKDVSADLVSRVQSGLNENGYECGTADGQAGTNTVLAICHFQLDSGGTPDGIADEELAGQLGKPAE